MVDALFVNERQFKTKLLVIRCKCSMTTNTQPLHNHRNCNMASLATQVAGKAASGAAARLVALRALMSSAVSKGLAAYVVPSADAHQV